MNKLFSQILPLVSSFYTNESEYENLTDEEKANMKYFHECLYESDEKFESACFHLMILILEVASRIKEGEEPDQLEIEMRKNKILDNFNDDDKNKLSSFMYVCIQNMGIYSKERVNERKLKNERND